MWRSGPVEVHAPVTGADCVYLFGGWIRLPAMTLRQALDWWVWTLGSQPFRTPYRASARVSWLLREG